MLCRLHAVFKCWMSLRSARVHLLISDAISCCLSQHLLHDPSPASVSEESSDMACSKSAKVPSPTEDQILQAFRQCPSLDIAVLKEHCPAVAPVVELIAATLCVGWECLPYMGHSVCLFDSGSCMLKCVCVFCVPY